MSHCCRLNYCPTVNMRLIHTMKSLTNRYAVKCHWNPCKPEGCVTLWWNCDSLNIFRESWMVNGRKENCVIFWSLLFNRNYRAEQDYNTFNENIVHCILIYLKRFFTSLLVVMIIMDFSFEYRQLYLNLFNIHSFSISKNKFPMKQSCQTVHVNCWVRNLQRVASCN